MRYPEDGLKLAFLGLLVFYVLYRIMRRNASVSRSVTVTLVAILAFKFVLDCV